VLSYKSGNAAIVKAGAGFWLDLGKWPSLASGTAVVGTSAISFLAGLVSKMICYLISIEFYILNAAVICGLCQMSGNVMSVVSQDGMSRAPVVRFDRTCRAHEVKVWLEDDDNYALILDSFRSTSRSAATTFCGIRASYRLWNCQNRPAPFPEWML